MNQHKLEEWKQWRQRLLARLAAERAYLLTALWGLSEDTLTTSVLYDNHTPKDILAHIAYWDGLTSERLAMVQNGRLDKVPQVTDYSDINARNRRWFERFRAASLEEVWALLLKERSGMLAALDRLPDELLQRRLRLPWEQRIAPRTWVRLRFIHDAAHAKDLYAWRQGLPNEQRRGGVASHFILRGLLKAGRKELTAVSQLVPADERNSQLVCGVWTLQDLLGHIVDWEKVTIDGLTQLAVGQTPEFSYRVDDFAVFNQANVEKRKGQAWETVWQEYGESHQVLIALFDQLDEAALKRPFTAPWGSPTTGYHFASVFAAHPRQHAADIRQALEMNYLPRYLRPRKRRKST